MARKIGMNPERVLEASARLSSCSGGLDGVRASVDRLVLASLNPVGYGVQPGGLIIAPWSIAGTTYAALTVRSAVDAVRELTRQLLTEALEQLEASDAQGSGLSPTAVSALTRAVLLDPDVITHLRPEQVAAWWSNLTREQQDHLIQHHPLVMGNAEGIPYSVRDAANRQALDQMLADPELPVGQRRSLESVRDALAEAQRRDVPHQLIILDFPAGADARAAISYGTLDDADSIGLLVPGMDNTVDNGMSKLGTAAYNLYREQQLLLDKAGEGGSPAVIAWMGYQTPGALPNTAVLEEGRAQDGSVYLTQTLGGIDATVAHDPRVTVFAHSYGSRTATYSLSGGGSADALVMFGSPGVAEGVDSVSRLTVPSGQVYVTRADADSTAWWGLVGSGNTDPLSAGFGAVPFSSEGALGREGIDGHGMLLAEDSNGSSFGYLDSNSDSLYDMALIGLGRGGDIE